MTNSFQNVLVVEDVDSTNMAVVQALQELDIVNVEYSQYCDDALLKIRKASSLGTPFELLVTDLSFRELRPNDQLTTGMQLIEAVKKDFPLIKIIVYSIEDASFRIKLLFEKYGINGYVIKGRKSIPELQKVVQDLFFSKDVVISSQAQAAISDKSLLEIESYDIELLKLLAKGNTQDNIGIIFKQSGISPSSSSSVEKNISRLKEYFGANNNVHLIAIAKDLGLV